MSKQILEQLTTPFTTHVSQLYALTNGSIHTHSRIYQALHQAGHSALVLRPATPWEPLAPLRHLCAHWNRPWPTWAPGEIEPTCFWLGLQVLQSRFFQEIAETLQGCRTVAWVEASDLQAPVWGDFLRLAQQHQLKIPVSFVFALPPEQYAGHGVHRISLDHEASLASPENNLAPAFGPPLPRHAAQYLGQAIFFGDTLDQPAMAAVSRAQHAQRITELQAHGILDNQHQIHPERLRFSGVTLPPQSQRWRRRALQQLRRLGQEDSPRALWLQFTKTPVIPSKQPLSQATVAASVLALGPIHTQHLLTHLGPTQATEEAHLTVYLALSRTPDVELPLVAKDTRCPGYSDLLQARLSMQQPRERIETLTQCLQRLTSTGPDWAAALVATELARWYLGLGRIQLVFPLLKPHNHSQHWAIQWLTRSLYAQAYARMGRHDLARNSLEQAVLPLPRPLSPVLSAELRLISSHHLSTDESQWDTQTTEARDVFRAAGDGARLGRYLLAVGEHYWQQHQWDDARNLMARALDLFRRYHDGIGMQETQLKLGLVLQRKLLAGG